MTRSFAWLALAAALTASCGDREAPAPETSTPAAADPGEGGLALSEEAVRAGGIAVVPVTVGARTDRIEAPGVLRIDETRTARIGSVAEGVVVETTAAVGDQVRAGARLAAIHSHEVHDAWAAYRKARADERRDTTELTYATDAEARAERLFARKAISRQEVERARADRAAAAEALEIARSEVTRAREELGHLGIGTELEDVSEGADQIPVRTPLAGIVLERLVTPGSAVTPGTPLFVVSDLSRLWAIAEIDEALLSRVRVGGEAELRVRAYPDDVFRARIAAIGQTVDPDTRRVSVRCEIANADGRLKPEMYASIRLGSGDERQALVVPSAAVQTVDGATVVFVKGSDGRFHQRAVVVGDSLDGRTEIRSGLVQDEHVVADGSFLLKSALVGTAEPE